MSDRKIDIVVFTTKAQNDLKLWNKSGNNAIINKISLLIKAIQSDPYNGIGKPEPLKHELSGAW